MYEGVYGVKYLLDTHMIIWYFKASLDLLGKMKELIQSPQNEVFISSASLWEIAIKSSLGKLDLSFTFDELTKDVNDRGFKILQIETEYLKHLSKLPLIHKDPFDRILVATAQAEKLTLVTADENIHKYDIPISWN